MIPIAQWPSLERVNRQFRRIVRKSWRLVKEIRLDEDFIYSSRYFHLDLFPAILKKLVLRAPKLKSISGFSEIWRHRNNRDGSVKLLAKFTELQRVSFANCRATWSVVAEFLRKSKSLGQLREINLALRYGFDSEEPLRLAFLNLRDFPPLTLEKLIFGQNTMETIYMESPVFQFHNVIDVSILTTLQFQVTEKNAQNFISLINRCTTLQRLDIEFSIFVENISVRNLLRSVATTPSQNLSILKLRSEYYSPDFNPEIVDLIRQLGRRGRLTEFSLVLFWCDDTIITAISDNLMRLSSLELALTNSSDDESLLHLVSNMMRLEKLILRGDQFCQAINDDVISALATNLTQLKSLHLEYPTASTKSFVRLRRLIRLKELRIRRGAITTTAMMAWSRSGVRLESLDLSECSKVKVNGLIALIKSQPSLRRLNLKETSITNQSLRAIATSCPILIELDVTKCAMIDIRGLRAIVDGCTTLKRLITTKKSEIRKLNVRKKMKYRQIKFD